VTQQAPAAPTPARSKFAGPLLRYRIMAFATGVVLICGTVALILKDAVHLHHMEPGTGLLWVGHGYLYLLYVLTTVNLAMKSRWPLYRVALVMLAGTVPTMSFVAEHFVTRETKQRMAAETGSAGAGI
jgi:integral membrane protein